MEITPGIPHLKKEHHNSHSQMCDAPTIYRRAEILLIEIVTYPPRGMLPVREIS